VRHSEGSRSEPDQDHGNHEDLWGPGTEKVYRKELRPVLTRGAEAMDIVFRSQPVDRQLDRQAADSGESA